MSKDNDLLIAGRKACKCAQEIIEKNDLAGYIPTSSNLRKIKKSIDKAPNLKTSHKANKLKNEIDKLLTTLDEKFKDSPRATPLCDYAADDIDEFVHVEKEEEEE